MAKKTTFSQIPIPTKEPEAILSSLLAMKENLETLTGEKGVGGWANQSFISREAPVARLEGDRWYKPAVLPGELPIESIWRGDKWEAIPRIESQSGPAGPQGNPGPPGPPGNDGADGADGTDGAPGPPGPPGVTYIGVVEPPAPLQEGQLWWYSDASPGGGMLYINYYDGNTWQWVPAAVSSPGPQGEQGNPGADGADGAPGVDGAPGADGAPGTTSVGVTPPPAPIAGQLWYYNDAVSGGGMLYISYFDGNTTQWVPAAVGPKGDTGPQGIQGIQGIPGPQGPQGIEGPVGAGGTTYISDTPPASPTSGMQWWKSSMGQLFIWFNDGTSSQWVPCTIGAQGPPGLWVQMTQAAYDALSPPDANTLYVIIG